MTSKRLTQGIQTGVEFDVPIALDSPASNGPRTATITLHSAKTQPLAVAALGGSPSLATVTDPGDGLKLVYAGSSVIYQRLNALPRIRWADSSVVVPDATSRVSLLASGMLDTSTVVLNSGAALAAPAVLAGPGADPLPPPLRRLGAPAADSSSANATVATAGATQSPAERRGDGDQRRQDSVGALVNSPAPGYLVVADSDQVGWSATVDGKAARLVPADQGLVAVSVPAGHAHGEAALQVAGQRHRRLRQRRDGVRAGRRRRRGDVVLAARPEPTVGAGVDAQPRAAGRGGGAGGAVDGTRRQRRRGVRGR